MDTMVAAMKSLDVEDHLAAKIERFREMVESQMNSEARRMFPALSSQATDLGRRGFHHISADGGKRRFVKVWNNTLVSLDERSILYFIEVETQKIYGKRSSAAYNPARCYGTLDTIDEWSWERGYPKHRTIMDKNFSLVPIPERV